MADDVQERDGDVRSEPPQADPHATGSEAAGTPREPVPATPEGAPEGGAGGGAAAAAAEWQGVRDYARAQGVELPYADDATALTGLLSAYRRSQERDYYAELGQRLAPHQDSIRQYLEGLETARRTAASAPREWEPPPFDPSWVAMVERDPESGVIRAKAGHDPAIAEKVTNYVGWRERFLATPHEVMRGLIQEEARSVAQEVVAAYRKQELADRLIQTNSGWLFRDDGGRRTLTPEGASYAQAVDTLSRAGIEDLALLDTLARTVVEHATLRHQFRGSGATPSLPAPAPAGAGSAPQPASRPPSAAGSARGGGSATAKSSSTGLSLRELLDRRLREFPADV